MWEVCIDINKRKVSVNLQKLSVQVMIENYFMLNPVVYTPWLQRFFLTAQTTTQNIRTLWFSANFFQQNLTLFQLGRNEAPRMLICFQFCLTWNWIVPISFTISLHYCWMHIRTLILRDLEGFLRKLMVSFTFLERGNIQFNQNFIHLSKHIF